MFTNKPFVLRQVLHNALDLLCTYDNIQSNDQF